MPPNLAGWLDLGLGRWCVLALEMTKMMVVIVMAEVVMTMMMVAVVEVEVTMMVMVAVVVEMEIT